ncbi:hypothetical protein ATCVCan0610SP_990R [Acanthocystis turfacea Chlorella virus Can0610SP]|nr:hypothetical protein ATCVCan0610SP_990R [Acanthocystis turfacea Chlorella virus Can0610SP]
MTKKCKCGKRAYFGVIDKSPTHCDNCKTDNMKDVISKKCQCGKHASFGVSEKTPTHCSKCKTPGMIDVKHTKCECGKNPSFGIIGQRPTRCQDCKEDGMSYILHQKCQCGKRRPVFGIIDKKPTHCSMCKSSEMRDVVNKQCPGYNNIPCPTKYQPVHGRDYCLVCDPDDSRRFNKKRDEAAFFNFLSKNGVNVTQREYPVHYQCIDTNKKYARLDGVIITKDIVVCLELDEDAHESYDPMCEEARMHNVSAELRIANPGHNIAWVRVNPHMKKNNKRVVSRNAMKIRDQRHREAFDTIISILKEPRDCINYIGYS